jgi:hypothetical protein
MVISIIDLNLHFNLSPSKRTISKNKKSNKKFHNIIGKIKFNMWSDYQSIGKIPTTFSSFVRILSIKFYPFNFTIYQEKDDFSYFNISDESSYLQMIEELKKNKAHDLKLFAFLIKDDEENLKVEEINERGKNLTQTKTQTKTKFNSYSLNNYNNSNSRCK